MNKYDDASYMLEMVEEEINAYMYGGLMLGWLLENNMVNPELIGEEMIDAFQNRQKTGPQLYMELDGKLLTDMLDPHADRFLQSYMLGDRPQYQTDFFNAFMGKYDSPFAVKDTWEDFEIVKEVIDPTYIAWLKENPA